MVTIRIKSIKQTTLAILMSVCFLLLSSSTVFAQQGGSGAGGGTQGGSGGAGGAQGGSGSGGIQTVALQNPLNSINSIEELLEAILYIFMTLMIPVIVFFIILAGFKYVTAQGNASKVEEANRALLYAVIGGVLVLGAVAIAGIIQSTVSAF